VNSDDVNSTPRQKTLFFAFSPLSFYCASLTDKIKDLDPNAPHDSHERRTSYTCRRLFMRSAFPFRTAGSAGPSLRCVNRHVRPPNVSALTSAESSDSPKDRCDSFSRTETKTTEHLSDSQVNQSFLLFGSFIKLIVFYKHNINIDTHTRTNIYPYEHIHVHTTHINISKKLSQFNFKIYDIDHQERLAIKLVGDTQAYSKLNFLPFINQTY
jgi:hypothetical protein